MSNLAVIAEAYCMLHVFCKGIFVQILTFHRFYTCSKTHLTLYIYFIAGFSLPNILQLLDPIREKVKSLLCQLHLHLYTNNYA